MGRKRRRPQESIGGLSSLRDTTEGAKRANSSGIALLAEGTLGIAARMLVEKEERALRLARAHFRLCIAQQPDLGRHIARARGGARGPRGCRGDTRHRRWPRAWTKAR